MGALSNIVDRVRAVWGFKADDKPTIPGMRESSFGVFDMFGMGTIGQNLRIDNDLMVRYADYEDMCLVGSSEVHTVNGRVKIEDLANSPDKDKAILLYAYDIKSERVVVANAYHPRKTGEMRAVYKVTFDSGEFICGTEDHLFLMRDGGYKQIMDLVGGDSVMPFKEVVHSTGYRLVLNPQCRSIAGRFSYVHRLVGELKYGISEAPKGMCFHHEDGNKENNDPSNISLVAKSNHTRNHAKFYSKDRPDWTDEHKLQRALSEIGLGKSGKGFRGAGFPCSDQGARKNKEITKEVIESVLKDCNSISEAAEKLKVDWNWLRRACVREDINVEECLMYTNHKVVSVDFCGYQDVYDLTTPVYHNFAVNGVFVHNCDYPLIMAAYTVISDDCTTQDYLEGKIVNVECKSSSAKRILNEMLHERVKIDNHIWEIAMTYCVTGDTRVWGRSVKEIVNSSVGDDVCSFENWKGKSTKVEEFHDNGVKDVYVLKTRHRELHVTGDHLVLVVIKNGKMEYKKVCDLKFGRSPNGALRRYNPKVVICTRVSGGKDFLIRDVVLKNRKENMRGGPKPLRINLPIKADKKFCRLFGFLMGDGWVTINDTIHTVYYSRSENEEINDFYDSILKEYGLNVRVRNSAGRTECSSTEFADLLMSIGWENGVTNKRIPQWVFELPEDLRDEFLSGFQDADGWILEPVSRIGKAYSFEICNYDLALDLKTLIDGLGYISGNVRYRERKGIIILGKKVKKDICGSYTLTYGREKFDSEFVAEAIISIDYKGKENVYDITVDNELHNFVANGIVIHNCKYGNDFEYIDIGEKGVKGLVFLPPPIMRRVERATDVAFYADLSGSATPENADMIFDRLKMIRSGEEMGKKDISWFPHKQFIWEGWQIIHWRNRMKNRGSLYGSSHGEPARWIWKRLVLLEDSALIFRLTRAPSRFVYYIDVGAMPPSEALAYVEKVKQRLKRSKFVNARTGKLDLRFNPMTEQDDVYLPVREGKDRTRVETLAGPEFQAMDDIEYFQSKLFSALMVPKSYIGYDETLSSRFILSSEDVRHARTVMRHQQSLKMGLRQLCDVELAANNIVPNSAEYKVSLSAPTKVMETSYIELMQLRMQLANDMRDMMSTEWVMEHVLKLTPSQINEIVGQREKETSDQADLDNEVMEKQMETQARVEKKMGIDPASMAQMGGGSGAGTGGMGMRPSGGGRRGLKPVTKDSMRESKLFFTDEEFTKGKKMKERETDAMLETLLVNNQVLAKRIDNLKGLMQDIAKNNRMSRHIDKNDMAEV